MIARLALLFILVPIVELALLVRLGQWVGLWPTLGLVITTGVAGAALARAEGLRTLARFQGEIAAGRLPGQALLDGLAVLVGGAFLLTPGILTDLAGLCLLLPPSRRWLQRRLMRWTERKVQEGAIQLRVWTPGGGQEESGPFGLDPGKEVGNRQSE